MMSKPNKRVWLIGGQTCALCDDASLLLDEALVELQPEVTVTVDYVDVQSSTSLYHLYGARIPVLLEQDKNLALYWPFTTENIKEFLRS